MIYTHPIPIHILVVEDDEDDFFLLKSSLRAISYEKEIYWAPSFDKAIELLEQQAMDVAFIDYRLGPHTGIDVIGYISQHYPYLPTILLTGVRESSIDAQALRSGAFDYQVKDQYSSDSLDRSIRYAIEKARVLRSLKESENKYRGLFENAMEYVFLINEEYKVLDANKAALELLSASSKDEVSGLKLLNYINSKDEALRQLGQGSDPQLWHNSLEVELDMPWEDAPIYCILNISPVNTQQPAWQLVLHDITERKLHEQKQKLMEKQALTGRVARTIAHEIKNPLTNIQLSLSELKLMFTEEVLSQLSDNPFDYVDIIERNTHRINNLIVDLLNATRYDILEMNDVLVEDLLNHAVAQVQDRLALKKVKFSMHIRDHLPLKGDKEKLLLVLCNILVNGIEAVEEGHGRLWINARAEGERMEIEISDNGKGIPAEDMPKLFEPFFTSRKGGTGLGLTAAYTIVVKHDGTINVHSKEGEGTSFTVSLPLAIK